MINITPTRSGPVVTDEENYLSDLTIARGLITHGKTPEIQNQGAKIMLELQNYQIDSMRYQELLSQARSNVGETLET